MGIMSRMQERMKVLEQQEAEKKQKELQESLQCYRPKSDSLPVRKACWIYGFFTLFSWTAFIGLSFINSRGFWIWYVLLPYLAQSIPLLLFTRGWVQMLFMEDGELTVKSYRKSIGQCKSSIKIMMLLWTVTAVTNVVFLILQRPEDFGKDVTYLAGCLIAAIICGQAQKQTNRIKYDLWSTDPLRY